MAEEETDGGFAYGGWTMTGGYDAIVAKKWAPLVVCDTMNNS